MSEANSPHSESSDDFDDEELARALPPESRGRKWLLRLRRARHKSALLFVGSFLESTVVPIPIEVILIPYMVAERSRVWRIATVTLLGCLLGALLGYAIGYFVFETFGLRIIEGAGWTDELDSFRELFNRHGFWAILVVGILPIPFQVAMLTAGAADYPLVWFILATLIARGLRYYGLAWLVRRFGPAALRHWRRRKLTVSLLAGGVLVALWLLLQWLGNLAGATGVSS